MNSSLQATAALLAALLGAWVRPACALDVYFAGFAFLGDAQAISQNYPYSSALAGPAEGGPSPLDRALRTRLSSLSNPTFTLVFDELGTLGATSTSTTALAFALDRETVSVERIAGKNKVLVALSAQALFFDFREKAVLASFPVTVQYLDVKLHDPTTEERLSTVRDLYLGDLGVNIVDEFSRSLSTVTLNPAVTRRVQVTDVTIGEGARPFLPAYLADASNLKATVAQEFSKFLSANQHIPVLPYTTGYAIGNRMAARFADGTVYNLAIPEPDYTISLRLSDLKKIEYSKTPVGSSYVYGAFLSVKAMEPLSNKIYFDATIKNGATKVVPASQENVDDWPAFQESLLVLMDKFTKAISTPDPVWAEKYAGNKGVSSDLEKLQKVLKSCR